MRVLAVGPEILNDTWPFIMEHIQQALTYEHGELTPEKVYKCIESGEFLLLVVLDGDKIKAAQTLEFFETPRGRVVNLVTTGGHDLEQWQDILADAIERVAREHEAISIRTRGRPGWLRQLKRNGYEPLYYIAEKRL